MAGIGHLMVWKFVVYGPLCSKYLDSSIVLHEVSTEEGRVIISTEKYNTNRQLTRTIISAQIKQCRRMKQGDRTTELQIKITCEKLAKLQR